MADLKKLVFLDSREAIARGRIFPFWISLFGFRIERRKVVCHNMILDQGKRTDPR